jgi:hypothetical protein
MLQTFMSQQNIRKIQMALKLLQPGIQPLGQFDGLDVDVLTLKGGEVVSFGQTVTAGQPGVTTPGLDHAAYDVFDGYVNEGGLFYRPVVTRLWDGTHLPTTGNYAATVGGRPLMLSDEGILGYGTLFGAVVGGTVGQQVNGPTTFTGALLGPHTATGSGKCTCWDKPGLYAVSLDAVDTTVATGLVPTNTTGLTIGNPLTFTQSTGLGTGGLLTPLGSGDLTVTGNPIVGHFVEFNTNQSLVTTPNFLVAALNSPSGNVSSVGPRAFQFATVYFAPPTT